MVSTKPTIDDPLLDKRVLLVEDNFLAGIMIKSQLENLGCQVVGPVAALGDASDQVAEGRSFDCAVLDIRIRGGTSESVAQSLEQRGIPFFFITGYQSGSLLAEALQSIPRLLKPVDQARLHNMLCKTLKLT